VTTALQDDVTASVVHAMRTMFTEETTEAVLLVDASNAFNTINRQHLSTTSPQHLHHLSTYRHVCKELL